MTDRMRTVHTLWKNFGAPYFPAITGGVLYGRVLSDPKTSQLKKRGDGQLAVGTGGWDLQARQRASRRRPSPDHSGREFSLPTPDRATRTDHPLRRRNIMICLSRAATSVPAAKYHASGDTQKAAETASANAHGHHTPARGDETASQSVTA